MPSSQSLVYFLPWEKRDNFPELLEKSGATNEIVANDLVAIKIHFGEKGGDGFIKPDLVRPVIQFIKKQKAKPFLTDTGTIYFGERRNAVSHLVVAADHGFTQTKLQTPVIIADGLLGDDYVAVEINGKHFKKVKIASAINNAHSIIALSHFKGHLLAGFGGAIKNLGMGCGSRLGKFEMHSSVAPTLAPSLCKACGACVTRCAQNALSIVDDKITLNTTLCAGCGECVVACDYRALTITWNEGATRVQEKFVEYAAGAIKNKRAFYVNFVNHVTPNCDCQSKGEKEMVRDIGILASKDPLAIDQASYDLVLKKGGNVFTKAHPEIDGTVQLAYAEKIGLGTRNYKIIEI